ncbi:MAG: hypothetical protein KDI36_08620 [Pseudomonadales bacterium]|nr:hypothetical protein [Pseudomonadales bacterium]
MPKLIASVILGGPDANSEKLGTLVGWLIANDLISETLRRDHPRALARVKMQDLPGSGFLTTALHGELKDTDLSEDGQRFVNRYYLTGAFDQDFASRQYQGHDEWILYDELAPVISRAFRGQPADAASNASEGRKAGKILQFPGRFRSGQS